jgi:hypothetical protein
VLLKTRCVPCDTFLLDSTVNTAIRSNQCRRHTNKKAANEREQRKSFLAFC